MNSKPYKFSLAVLTAILVLTGCNARKELVIQNSWARSALQGGNSAVYFQIYNPTSSEDILKSAQCTRAERTEIHKSMMDEKGVMKMQPQESVAAPAGATTSFEPGGFHIMLINLKQDLKTGENLELSLTFEHAGVISVSAPVKQP